MAWNYRIYEERHLVVSTAWDKVTGAQAVDHQHKLLSDPRFERDFFQFVDLADVRELEMDRVTVAELARCDLFSPRSRRAFFAPNPLAYGVSRMFIAFREGYGGEQMDVFKDRAEAFQWLGIAPFD